MIEIRPGIQIDENELRFTTSRSRGPGGQNVNKVESRVTLQFDVVATKSLTAAQRELILRHAGSRLTRDGLLRIDCEVHRSQEANRREVIARFSALLAKLLRPKKPRKRTRPTRASREKRLRQKARRSDLKRSRSRPQE